MLNLGNTVAVTEDNTNLGRRGTLPGELADVVDNLVRGDLNPGSRGAGVRQGRRGDTLSLGVKTTHFELVVVLWWLSDGLRLLSRASRSKQKL